MSYDANGKNVLLWYRVECFIVNDGNVPISVIGKMHDITRIKQAQMSMSRERIENMYHDHDTKRKNSLFGQVMAESGEEALKMIDKNHYDIVFMDHFMPGMDGVETTAHLRALDDEKKSKLPIIALTADAMKRVREVLISKGMSDFLTKPIIIGDLYKMLRKWLPKEKLQ